MKKTYVFRYDTKDGKFLGYHYDSFCTTGTSLIEAKRYPMTAEVLPEQMKTIRENLESLCRRYTDNMFHGHPVTDVILSEEELAESVEQQYPHTMKWARIEMVDGEIETIPMN